MTKVQKYFFEKTLRNFNLLYIVSRVNLKKNFNINHKKSKIEHYILIFFSLFN